MYFCRLQYGIVNMEKRLAIVILNWNGRRLLEQFLPTLLSFIPDFAEVIIADNASTDDSIDFLKMNHPTIRIIQNSENYGFAKGYNLALQQVDAEYYCLLNSDIEVTENWVLPVMELLDSHPEIAAVQPKLRSYMEREKFEYAGASGGFMDKYGYPFCRGRVFDTVEIDENQYDTSIDIFWATGAALFVRRSVYWEVGGMDDDFFAHMEEIDLCWRIKNAGYRIVVEPKSLIYHVGGGTLPKQNPFKTYLNFRNNHFLLIKNLPRHRLFPTLMVRLLLDNVAALSFLLKGNGKDFAAVYRAHAAVVKQYAKMKKKRSGENFLAYKDVSQLPCLVAYYLKKQKYFNGIHFVKK